MKNLTSPRSPVALFTNALSVLCCIAPVCFIAGCTIFSNADTGKDKISTNTHPLAGDPNKHKSIFVFLDGTRNGAKSGTNVWRLYDLVSNSNDPQMTAFYIEGVGTVENPLLGAVLGRGMEDGILRGYEFIAQNYNPGDDIYVFGFSRGAHEARSLAGLLAYAGVPVISGEDRKDLITIGNKILELTKDKLDKDYIDKWTSWKSGQAPLLAEEIKDKVKLEMRATEVKFLGVWDTVPGSSFKKYQNCKEAIGFFKTYFFWLPVITKGERYKSDSYPAIHQIAHAVSLDEKRSKFAPLLLCPAISSQYPNTLSEVWFPGAHGDVGGGYEDSNGLPGISLNWMLGLLAESYKFYTIPPQVAENAKGLAHWSIGDAPANRFSDCEDRHPTAEATIHKSFSNRIESSPVPIRKNGTPQSLAYPMACPAK